MKGISEWIWLVGGVIAAVLVFTISMILYQNTVKASIEKKSIEEFSKVVSIINNVCWEFEGTTREYKLELGETIQGIYAADISHPRYDSKQLTNNIISSKSSSGNNLCIQIQGKKEQCEKLDCPTIFPFIGAVPEEFSISAFINQLTGRGRIYDYYLQFVRTINPPGVEVTSGGLTTTTRVSTTTFPGTSTSTLSSSTTTLPTSCSPGDLANKVDGNNMKEIVNYLSQKSRHEGTDWNKETANWVRDKLASYGLENTQVETIQGRCHPGWGGTATNLNVMGELGSGSQTIIITGGHRDSESPGAVDNAAGTADVMEIARVLAACKDKIKNFKLKFILFDVEERGMCGSQAYYDKYKTDNIKGMLNFDCTGWKNSKKVVIYRSSSSPYDLSTSADKACNFIGSQYCYKPSNPAPDASDHAPFMDGGINILFFISYDPDNPVWTGDIESCGDCYHQSCDTSDKVSKEPLEWAAKTGAYILADLYLS